jgi:hypothetical protein
VGVLISQHLALLATGYDNTVIAIRISEIAAKNTAE